MLNLASLTTRLNPYAIHIKIVLAAALVAGLFWLGWHEMGIRANLQIKTTEAALNKATTEMYAQQFNEYIKLNKETADAIKAIRIHSNNYIQAVENSKPDLADGDNFVLVPAGVPAGMSVGATLPGLSRFKNNSASRAAAGTAGNPGGQAGR